MHMYMYTYTYTQTHQVNLIKLCLCSSLYPNVAIGDAGNVNRRVNEAVFMTYKKTQVYVYTIMPKIYIHTHIVML